MGNNNVLSASFLGFTGGGVWGGVGWGGGVIWRLADGLTS